MSYYRDNQERLNFLMTKRRLEDWLQADVERQWAEACQALADKVTASIYPDPVSP